MSVIVKLVGAGIGLASEGYKAHKASKIGGTSQDPAYDPPQYAEVTQDQADDLIARRYAVSIDRAEAERVRYNHRPEEGDEEIWALDDAGNSGPESESTDAFRDSRDVAATFLRRHPLPARQLPLAPLPCPVILPQRRPKNDKRGFVEAYAPVLAAADVSQATFLEFLEAFQLSGRADPWLNVINTAAMIAGAVPELTVQATTAAVKIAVGIAMEVQRRTKSANTLPEEDRLTRAQDKHLSRSHERRVLQTPRPFLSSHDLQTRLVRCLRARQHHVLPRILGQSAQRLDTEARQFLGHDSRRAPAARSCSPDLPRP
jgi:hypothetical protein